MLGAVLSPFPGLPLATFPGPGQGLRRDTTQVSLWDGGQRWLVSHYSLAWVEVEGLPGRASAPRIERWAQALVSHGPQFKSQFRLSELCDWEGCLML